MPTPRTRTTTWDDPTRGAEIARTMTGIDYLRAIVSGDAPAPPIAVTLGFTITEVESGRVVFEVEPADFHYNPLGVVHGGVAATILDSAMACAVQSTLPVGVGYTTLDLHTRYLRAITVRAGRLHCEGRVVQAGARVATAEGRLVGSGGKIYATGTESCLIIPLTP
jgi:uncharacterized protein (TIGR00369 family)